MMGFPKYSYIFGFVSEIAGIICIIFNINVIGGLLLFFIGEIDIIVLMLASKEIQEDEFFYNFDVILGVFYVSVFLLVFNIVCYPIQFPLLYGVFFTTALTFNLHIFHVILFLGIFGFVKLSLTLFIGEKTSYLLIPLNILFISALFSITYNYYALIGVIDYLGVALLIPLIIALALFFPMIIKRDIKHSTLFIIIWSMVLFITILEPFMMQGVSNPNPASWQITIEKLIIAAPGTLYGIIFFLTWYSNHLFINFGEVYDNDSYEDYLINTCTVIYKPESNSERNLLSTFSFIFIGCATTSYVGAYFFPLNISWSVSTVCFGILGFFSLIFSINYSDSVKVLCAILGNVFLVLSILISFGLVLQFNLIINLIIGFLGMSLLGLVTGMLEANSRTKKILLFIWVAWSIFFLGSSIITVFMGSNNLIIDFLTKLITSILIVSGISKGTWWGRFL